MREAVVIERAALLERIQYIYVFGVGDPLMQDSGWHLNFVETKIKTSVF